MSVVIEDPHSAQEVLEHSFEEARSAVFFGGAGVSVASGIPDFRSQDGLYNTQYKYPPETILSHSFWKSHTSEFYEFYRAKMLHLGAKPNQVHEKLATFEYSRNLSDVITQNIDGLHQAAGSHNVLELHGSVHRNYCFDCARSYSARSILSSEDVPRCVCGGVVKPDVVLYEEALEEQVLSSSLQAISQADLLVIGGTSLMVYPAASLVRYFSGKRLIVCNLSATQSDMFADYVLKVPIQDAFNF